MFGFLFGYMMYKIVWSCFKQRKYDKEFLEQKIKYTKDGRPLPPEGRKRIA
jgi:hypothetical protein